jgi:hypothetical protein
MAMTARLGRLAHLRRSCQPALAALFNLRFSLHWTNDCDELIIAEAQHRLTIIRATSTKFRQKIQVLKVAVDRPLGLPGSR